MGREIPPTGAPYPIHFSQNAFIYGEAARPGAWSIGFELELPACDAADDDTRLTKALNQLLDRHEALRYRFVRDWTQTQAEDPALPWLGYRQVPTTRQLPPRGVARYDSPEAFPDLTRFRPTRPPFVRLHLADGPGGRRFARLDTHHLVVDGWSRGIIRRDLLGLLSDGGTTLPRSPAPYGEFVQSEYESFSQGLWEPSLDWWCEVLRDPPDHAWPGQAGAAGRMAWTATIAGAPYRAARQRLAALRVSPFTALASIYARAVGRAFGWDRLTLFVLYANRRRGTWDTVGQFSNIFYLPVDLAPLAPLGELTRAIGRRMAEIMTNHGHVWMKYVLDRLSSEAATRLTGGPTVAIRDAIELPLETRSEYPQGEGGEISIHQEPKPSAQHGLEADLILDFVHRTGQCLHLVLTCDRSRVEDEGAQRILTEIASTLTAVPTTASWAFGTCSGDG